MAGSRPSWAAPEGLDGTLAFSARLEKGLAQEGKGVRQRVKQRVLLWGWPARPDLAGHAGQKPHCSALGSACVSDQLQGRAVTSTGERSQ